MKHPEPFAWVMPGEDTHRDGGWIDCNALRHGEFTEPVYSQETVDELMGQIDEMKWTIKEALEMVSAIQDSLGMRK